MKVSGKDGKLYEIKPGEVITGGASATIPKSGFYMIKSISSSASGFPDPDATVIGGKGVAVGYVYYLRKGQSLATGDSVIPFELEFITFIKDVPKQQSGTSYDATTQENLDTGVRSYIASPFTDGSGTITGNVDTESAGQRRILNLFNEIVEDDGEHITRRPAKQRGLDFMLSRYETDIVGETAVWEYFPIICESLTMDKPLEGVQPFSFGYKIDGDRKPSIIYHTVTEEEAA